MAGCAVCGRPGAHRVDLTYGDVDPKDAGEYSVQAVVRGLLLCAACAAAVTLDELLARSGDVAIVRGCLVQCTGQPPWWLRPVMPGMPPAWRKVTCPSCGGRATVQLITEAAARELGAFARGILQVFDLFRWRDPDAEEDDDAMADPDLPGPGARVEGDVSRETVAVADEHQEPERTAGGGADVAPVSPVKTAVMIGGEGWNPHQGNGGDEENGGEQAG